MIRFVWLFRWPLAVLAALGLVLYWPAITLHFAAVVLGLVVVILVGIAAWVLVRLPIGRVEIYHFHDLQDSRISLRRSDFDEKEA